MSKRLASCAHGIYITTSYPGVPFDCTHCMGKALVAAQRKIAELRALVGRFREHCDDCALDSQTDLEHEDLLAEREWDALLARTDARGK